MAEDFAGRRAARRRARRQHLRVLARAPRSPPGARAAAARRSSSRTCPTPRTSVSSSTTTAGTVIDLAEKAGVVDLRYPAPPTNDAVVGLYCYPPDVFAVIASLERSSRGELEITDVNRAYARAGRAVGRAGARLVGGRGQALAAPRRDRPHDRRDGRQQVSVDGIVRIPLRRFEDERGWFCELRRESLLPKPTRADERVASRGAASSAASTTTSAARTTSSPACRERRASSCSTATTGATFTEDIGDENPVALYIPGRHAHGFEALTDLLFVYHVTEEYDPADPDEHGHPLGRPPREGPVEHADADPLGRDRASSPPPRPDHGRGRPARRRARRSLRRRTTCARSTRADWDVRVPCARRARRARSSCCTRRPGRTWTAPRTTRRAPPR